jgi:hypothetical protein
MEIPTMKRFHLYLIQKSYLSLILLGTLSLAAQAQTTPQIVGWGSNHYLQLNVPAGLTNVVAIATGWQHNLALKPDGTVAAWGDNANGQCSVPASATNVVAISGGSLHSLALKSDGTVVAWGHNFHGQTNVPAGLTNVVAIAGGVGHSLALKSDGTVVAWGDNEEGQCNVPAGLTNVTAIAAGFDHSITLVAQSYYVDSILGNDTTGNGTPELPFKTVSKALPQALTGRFTYIYIRAGNYGSDRPRVTQKVRFINWGNAGRASIGKP